MDGWISAAHPDGQRLGDVLRNGEEARHGFKGTAHEVGIEPATITRLPMSASLSQTSTRTSPRN